MERFLIEGINGKHQCLVYDLYGMSVDYSAWPVSMVKRLAKDALRSLEFIHDKQMCHANTSLVLLYDMYYEALMNYGVLDI